MKRKQMLFGLLSATGMLILILDGKTAIAGAQAGISLCIRTVIPSLFPFFVLSGILIQSNCVRLGNLPGIGRVFRNLSGEAAAILIPGFLGGYPVGAQSVFQSYQSGKLSKKEAERMLAFCNNAGPAFLFGMVGQMFPNRWMPWLLWGIHVTGAVLAAWCIPAAVPSDHSTLCTSSFPTGDIMAKSVRTMGTVCGWIVLFRVVISFLDRWLFSIFPPEIRVALIGLLELSNGCCELPGVSDVSLRFFQCGCMLSVGGVCVTMQTRSVTEGLSLRYYFRGKCIQLWTSLVLGGSILLRTPLPILLLLPIVLYAQKSCGNRKVFGV